MYAVFVIDQYTLHIIGLGMRYICDIELCLKAQQSACRI